MQRTNRLVPSFFAVMLLPLASSIAQDSVIDLTRIDFKQPSLHSMAGSWDFYWNQLLTPEDFLKKPKPEKIYVPGAWNRQSAYPALGCATYYTKIKLPGPTSGLVVYFPVINSAAKVYINGEKVAETGTVSLDEKLYQPQLVSTVVEVPPNRGELELVVQCVNYTYFSGGISGTPQIGKTAQLMAQLNRTQGIENFFAGSLIAMWVYQLVLYFLFHRGKPYLWLSLICLGVALRALIVHGGSFLLPNLFPAVSWEIWKKIEFGSVYGIGTFFPLYIYHLFRETAPKWPLNFFVVISTLLCLAVLVTPQYVYGQLLEVSHVALLLSFFYAIYSVGKAWRYGNKDAGTIFLGVLASFPFILTEILKNSVLSPLNIHFMYLVEMGVLVFLLFQVYLLANHYAKSYKNLESLNQNLEKMVTERSGQLLMANRVKDRLLSVISHDIKSPLNSLKGMLTIYNQGAVSVDEFKSYSRRIEGDLDKTSLLVDNILYWTASQIKGAVTKSETFDLRELLRANVGLYQTIASTKGITINSDLNEPCIINFDRNILDLTLRNLIANAIKFSFEGGTIEIKYRSTASATLIEATDHGTGMDGTTLESIQTNNPVESLDGTSDETGTGLGLSLCREYLQMAGGELKINSVKGAGSTFIISIPK